MARTLEDGARKASSTKKYKKLMTNTVLFAINALSTKLISFVLVPLYTAYMSAGEYGVIDMAQTVVSLVTPIATLSIADAAIRFMIKDRERSDEYSAISFAITILSIPIVCILTPLLNLSVFGGLGHYGIWFIVSYTTGALLGLMGQVARGFDEIKLIPFSAFCSSIATLAGAFLCIVWAGLGIRGYFISLCVGQVIGIAAFVIGGESGKSILRGLKKLYHRISLRESVKHYFSQMLKYSLPLVPNSLFWWIGTSVSRLFITGMLGIAASGMYAAASKIPNLLNTAYSIFLQAWQLSAFQELNSEGVERFYSTVFRVLQASMSILCSLLSLLSPVIAALLLQGETFSSWPMIPILLLANLFSLYSSFYGTVYTSTMHTDFIMKTTFVVATATALLTPLMLALFGLIGACMATAISQAVVAIVRAIDSRKYIDFDPGLRTLLVTIALLILQAAVTSAQLNGWQYISGICMLAVVIIQCRKVLPLVRRFLETRKPVSD